MACLALPLQLPGFNCRIYKIMRIRYAILFLVLITTLASAQTSIRINFVTNSISHEWRGVIANRGNQDFLLRLGRGQDFQVGGRDVYTWSATDPRGNKIGCNNRSYCCPGESMYLQMSGDYTVYTYFRMDSSVNQPVVSSRRVHLLFVAQ